MTMFQSLQNYYKGEMKHYPFHTMIVHGDRMRKFYQVKADFRGETDLSISEFFVPADEEVPESKYSTYTMTEYYETYESAKSCALSWKSELNLKGFE